MSRAFDDLSALGVGVQLTPGNHPTAAFAQQVHASQVATRRHHGFAFDRRLTAVWSADGHCLVDAESVHPPVEDDARLAFAAWYDAAAARPALETMYPGCALGTGAELDDAMSRHWPLAVDVSHLFIQRTQGVLGDATLARLYDYPHITEVHVSANDGQHDTHRPLTSTSFGLSWALERARAGVPLVLECYFHQLSTSERREQLALLGQDS